MVDADVGGEARHRWDVLEGGHRGCGECGGPRDMTTWSRVEEPPAVGALCGLVTLGTGSAGGVRWGPWIPCGPLSRCVTEW